MDLLIVGLDGLSFNMLDRFDIELPFFEETRAAGVSGDLMSVDTPTTVPAWTSFATGKDPGSHGITDMVRQDPDYAQGPNRPNTTDAAIYDFFDEGTFVHLPASAGRAPAATNTRLVSAWLATNKEEAVPDEFRSLDSYDDYVVNHNPKLKSRPKKYLEHVVDISRRRRDFAREAFEATDPAVGFVLFSTPDWAGHLLSNLGSDAQRERFYATLLEAVDACASDLAGMADNALLMSDHGFEFKHTNVHIAEWLSANGYFREVESKTTPSDVAVEVGMALAKRSDRIYRVIRRVHNLILGLDWGTSLQTSSRPNVDYPRSRAWQLRYATILLNDDRFDSPTVEDPDALAGEIREGLSDLTDEEGNDIFRDVVLPEEAYADPTEWAPDVIARPAPGYHPLRSWSPTGGVTSRTENYEHRYRGVFVAEGPLFATGDVEGMRIVDVLPTALAALGEPLSPEFDGEARLDVLADPAEPTVLAPDEVPEPRLRAGESASTTAERDEAVEGRLADLGYLE